MSRPLTVAPMPVVPHEDAEMLALMATPVALQQPTLSAWGMPRTGLLHLLSSCHGSCFFCSNATLVEMPPELVTTAAVVEARLDGVEGLDLDLLVIGGTEPTTHPSLDGVLRRTAAAGVATELMTSGLTLAGPREAARLAALGVRRVAVPLYAPAAAVHDDVVGRPGQFARVVEGLDAARAAGIEVAVHTLALRRTLAAIRPLAAFVRRRWDVPLVVAPLRRKDDRFRYEDEAPSYAEVEAVVEGADVTLVGFPDCVAPSVPRGAPPAIALYFRTQRLTHAAPCDGCAARATCRGAVPAHLEVYGEEELRPR